MIPTAATMIFSRGWAFILLALLAEHINAQVFPNLLLGIDYPGISSTCSIALNTTLTSCPSLLGSVSVDNTRLDSESLALLCTSGCQSELTSVRQTIASGCNLASDIITYEDVDYPATLIIDRFIYTYDLSCRTDSASGKFCDEIFTSWLNQSTFTAAQNCSDCMLGVMEIQLNSPFGYDKEFAADFDSVTSSCGASAYAFTSPAPYGLNSTVTTVPAPIATPNCASPYLVQSTDSCDSIALAYNVSTFSIITAGNLSPDCSNLQGGISLCLPGSCNLYRVQYDDTCESILAANSNMTGTNLLSWNPNINVLCTNIGYFVQTLICLSAPGGNIPQPVITSPLAISTATTAVPKPTNAFPESNSNCAKWYTIQEGDNCQGISLAYSISLSDFYFLNPEIYSNCSNLDLGVAYCIQAVGSITTYSGYPTTSPIYTLTSLSYVTTTSNFSTVANIATPIVTLPIAPGTISNCVGYIEWVDVPDLAEQAAATDVSVLTDFVNDCDFAISAYNVELSDFISWNPILASVSPCMLQANYSYCALNSTSILIDPEAGLGSPCLEDVTPYPGTISTCSCFTLVEGSISGLYLCSDLAFDSNITTAEVMAWNPWVGSDCDSGLYANLDPSDRRGVCIGNSSTATTSISSSTISPQSTITTTTSAVSTTTTSSSPTATTSISSSTISSQSTITTTTSAVSTTTTGNGISTPTPYQTGMATNCNKFHLVVSGDQCGIIASNAGVSLADFYAWNPAVGSTCATLDLGDYVCIDVIGVKPSTTTTTTSTTTTSTTPANGIATPTPYQTGMATNCDSFHYVISGDQCGTIASKAGISLTDFYTWNPAVGSTCATLDLGDYVCIGTLTCTSASVLPAPKQYSSTCGPIGYSHDSPTSLLITSYTSGPYVASAAACGTQCLATPTCTNLYFIEGRYCNLHRGTSTFELSTSGGYEWFEASCFSSGKACGSYGFSHDTTSTLIRSYTSGSQYVASAAACGAECFSTSTCTNVYFIQGSHCNLHSGPSSYAESTAAGFYSWYPLDCFVCTASS